MQNLQELEANSTDLKASLREIYITGAKVRGAMGARCSYVDITAFTGLLDFYARSWNNLNSEVKYM